MIRIFKQHNATETTYSLLLNDLQKTKHELDLAYSNFANVVEPDLIDSCIYQVNSIHMRYKFLLGRVKQIENSCNNKTQDQSLC